MRSAPAALPLLLACALSGSPAAEEAPAWEGDRLLLYQDILDESNIRQLMDLAKGERDRGNWEKALGFYEQLQARYGDTLCPSESDRRLYQRLDDRIRREILALPPEALARYRLRLDPEARRLLDRALRDADPAPAAEALARYGVSNLGRRAAELLGDLRQECGEPGAAAAAWESAVLDPSLGGDITPTALGKLALARACQGRGAEALALAGRLPPDARLRIGGESLEASGWGAWLGTLAPRGPDQAAQGWPEMGRSSGRLSVSERLPWIEKTWGWKLPPAFFPKPAQQQYQGMWQGIPRLPVCLHAAAAEGLFAISNGETLYLVDAKGRPGAIQGKQPLQTARAATPQTDWMNALRPFAVTITDGMAIANLMSRRPAAAATGMVMARFGGMQAPRCDLLAMDLATSKLRWQFPPPGSAESQESQFDVRTAPVPCGDTLVAACTRQATATEVWLVGLGLADGKLRWKRFLCASPASQGLNLVAEPALASDGRLAYCLSQRGAVLAVEAETGRACWAYRYAEAASPPEAPARRGVAFGRGRFNAQATPPRPFSPPIVKGGVVYALPADAGRLLALDAHSGRLRWQRATEADQLIGLVSVLGEDRLVLTGPAAKGTVVGIQADSREASFNIPDGGVAGRGMVTPDAILVPTPKGVASIDLVTLKLTGSLLAWPTDFSPKLPGRGNQEAPASPVSEGANLIAAEGWLFAVGSQGVLAYPIPETKETGLQEELKANPQDPAVRLRLARHHRARQEPGKALEALREGWRLVQGTPAGERDREQILAFLTATLREQATRLRKGGDPAASAALLLEALLLPQSPPDEADLRLEAARVLAASRQGTAALAQLDTILDRLPDTMIEKAGTFRAADAARQEIGALLEADPPLREARTAAARAQLAAAGQDPGKLEALVSRYADSPVAEEALLALARLRLASDRPEGIRLLSACAIRRPGSAPALSALEDLLAVAASDADAAWQTALLEELSAQYERNGAALPSRFLAMGDLRKARADPWASDPFPLVEGWHVPANEQTGLLSVPGNGLTAWSRAVLLSTGQMLDADTGKLVWQSDDPAAAKGWMGVGYDAGTSTVSTVYPGTQAERAGILPGDRILALNDLPAEGRLQEAINTLRPGQTVAVKVQREGRIVTLDLQLARRPADGGDGRFRWAAPQGPLILLGSGSEICAYDIVARGLAWRLPLEAEPQPEEDGQFAVDPHPGTVWAQAGGRASFTVLAGRCVVRDGLGGLHGIDVLKGERLWTHEVQDFGEEVVPVDEREVACLAEGSLHLVDRATGRSRLTVPLPQGVPGAPPLVLPGRGLVLALPGQLLCLSLKDGKPLWTAPVPERDAAILLCATGTRLLAAGGSQAAAYDPASGQRAWQMALTGFRVAGTVVSEDTLYLSLKGEKGGAVMAIASDSGQVRWKQALGQEASCPRPLALGRFLVVDAGRDPDDPKAGGNLVLFLDRVTGKRIGSLVIPWNRGRLHAIHRCGTAILLETSSALYCYKPKAP